MGSHPDKNLKHGARPPARTHEHNGSVRGWRNADGDSPYTRCGERITAANDGGAHLRSKGGDARRCDTKVGGRRLRTTEAVRRAADANGDVECWGAGRYHEDGIEAAGGARYDDTDADPPPVRM